MDIVSTVLNLEVCLVYLHDIIVYSRTIDEHIALLTTFRHAGLKLKPEKCALLQKSVSFLGHIISDEGIIADPDEIRAVMEWPQPTSVKDIRAFLGFGSYYRRFVKDFADIAAPLHANTRKNNGFQWSSVAEKAFQMLKKALCMPPILAIPSDNGEFLLETYASDRAIGAILSQKQDGIKRVVSYASRSLDRREQNYCVTRRELLVIVHFM